MGQKIYVMTKIATDIKIEESKKFHFRKKRGYFPHKIRGEKMQLIDKCWLN